MHAQELVDINLDTKTRRRRLKRRLLRVIIPVACVLFMVATILSISAYGYYVNRRDTLALSDDLLKSLDRRIATQVHEYLIPASEMVGLAADIVEDPSYGIDNRSDVEALAIPILRAYPQLATFLVANTKGDFLMLKKMPDGAIHTKNIEISEAGRRVTWTRRDKQNKIVNVEESVDDTYDPRARPWYVGAVKEQALFWTEIYIFFTDQSPGITVSMPVFDPEKKLRGVLGVDIKLAELSAFLNGLKIGRHGRALIFDEQGRLVAYPETDRMLKKVEGELQPVMLDELGDPVLDRAYSRFQIEGHGSRDLMVDNRRYMNTVSSLESTVGRDWSIMIIVPEDDFVGFVRENFRTILLMTGVIVILASLLAGLLVFQGLRADRNAKLVLDRKQELEAQSRAFSELASKAAMFDPADSESLGELTRIVSAAVAVRRASVWHFVDDGQQLMCDDCYDRESSGHTQGTLLDRVDYPQMFDALQTGKEIVVSDAADDPLLSELHRAYLRPLGCTSLLAVPVTLQGRTAATIWFEHEGQARKWDSEDISFARAIAGMLALRLAATGVPDETADPTKSGEMAGNLNDRTSATKSASTISDVDTSDSSQAVMSKQTSEHPKGNGQKISFSERLLKQGLAHSSIKADVYDNVTVLALRFTDPFALAEYVGGGDNATTALDHLICHFEDLLEARRIDYWKILSDQIVCAAGMQDNSNHPVHVIAELALSFQDTCSHLFADLDKPMEFKIGIDTGGVIGSPVGRRRKSYNIWGEAVSTALMMADNAVTGGIQVSETTYRRLRQNYLFRVRGRYYLQNIGEISTYLLTGRI